MTAHNSPAEGLAPDAALTEHEEFEAKGAGAGRAKRPAPLKWVLRLIQGGLIGGGAILPGISGGVLAVAFGVYQPMMALLAHPKRNLPRYGRLLLPVGLGWILGFVFFARLVEAMFNANEVLTTWLFVGLIGGTLPSLFRTAGKQGRSPASWLGCAVAFVLFLAFMLWARVGFSASLTPNLGWYVFCGVLWGLSVVVPGMTSSSLLMSMGLYLPMTAGVASMDMGVVLPMVAGAVLVALLLARGVNLFFETRYALAYHCVIGLMLASTVVIIPLHYTGLPQILLSALAAGVGFVLAWAMEKYGQDDDD